MVSKLALLVSLLLVAARPVQAAEPFELPLWPGVAPGSEGTQMVETTRDRPVTDGTDVTRDMHVAGVTAPTMTVYSPSEVPSNSTAVIVLPGGGFSILAIDKEGHDVARWLNGSGVTAIVVKYRLPDKERGIHVPNGCLVDVQRAIRLTRLNAEKWQINPEKVGVMGFSAGGYLTAAAGTMFDRKSGADDLADQFSARPNFIAPIYPLIALEAEKERAGLLQRMFAANVSDKKVQQYSPDLQVTSETPPTFLVHAHDDGLTSDHSVVFYQALKRAGVSAELHIYSQGGHGYGIRQRGLPVSGWHNRCLDWMRKEAFIE